MWRLHPHVDTPSGHPLTLEAVVVGSGDRLDIRFRLQGDLSRVLLPPPGPSRRVDGLWRSTCFEAFVMAGDIGGYREYNFASSSEWAAYEFDAYRTGMRDAPTTLRRSEQSRTSAEYRLAVQLRLTSPACKIGLSAVIEETDGTKSYWALRHPAGAPDFHHPDCFALTLPAPKSS